MTCCLETEPNTKYDQAWQEEDFSYQENDENNEIARSYTYVVKKKAARLPTKAAKKKTKSEKIEYINLSRDKEGDEEFELDDFSDYFSDGDEIQIVSHGSNLDMWDHFWHVQNLGNQF